MAAPFKGRSLLKLTDLTDGEMLQLVELAATLKAEKARGLRGDRLHHRSIALIFEKMSTRTRCAVAVAAADEGGSTQYLGAHEIHLGKKESVVDTARVLGRMFDGIMFRGFEQATVEALAKHAGVPVWNGLTDQWHPTQALADLLTIKEVFGRWRGLTVAYVGDGRNNVANSLMVACAKAGINVVNCTPPALEPDPQLVAWCRRRGELNGSTVAVANDPRVGVKGANVVYTDVWVSMGEEDKQAERIALLKPYQVNMALMQATGNLERQEAIFLHCLPAFHDDQTDVTREIGALEVTNDVFEAPFSRTFDEAENRMHTIKAILVASMGIGLPEGDRKERECAS
jgi:ornithine carbamoyltransferase